jgi:hypothetical protein
VRNYRTAIVSLFLVAVVVGILLGAVSRIREAAARTACKNNIKQIGLAISNYHDQMDAFPAATMPSERLPPEKRLSWLFDLDPFIHARMDESWGLGRNEPWDAEVNARIARGRMPWYLCDTNPIRERDGFAVTHYVGIAGVGADAAQLPKTNPRAGFFGYDRHITQKDVTDGLGSTLMVVETVWDNGPWVAGGFPTTRALTSPNERSYLGTDGQFGSRHRRLTTALFPERQMVVNPRQPTGAWKWHQAPVRRESWPSGSWPSPLSPRHSGRGIAMKWKC